MKKSILIIFLLSLNLGIRSQNIMISNSNKPNEPTIIIDPKHPNVLIAASNLSNYYVSIDTGYTWTIDTLHSFWGSRGDPVLNVDTLGNFYFIHLVNSLDRIICEKSNDNGLSWPTLLTSIGYNGTKCQDKPWCVIDRKSNFIYITWTQFDKYNSYNKSDSSVILFSRSEDAGITWSSPVRISKVAGDCVDSSNTVEGAVPTIGPNGEVFVAWAGPNGIVFNKSLDHGKTWLEKEISVDPMPGGWNLDISGIYRTNGFPITTCDLSNGINRGTIYINWSDQRNGITNTDIWLVKSIDGGNTWSKPIKVNNDNSNKQQFFTWMTIDQTNGFLYFIFYDRRNYTNDSTDVYLALSTDGGNSFINKKISQSPFLPDKNIFFGDYTNIVAYNGIIRPIWTRLNNGYLSLWTNITNVNDLLSEEIKPITFDNLNFENYPNPTNNYTYVSFKLYSVAKVNLSILDINGKVVAKIINNSNRGFGKYIERIDLDNLSLSTGVYFLRLEVDDIVKTNRQIRIK